MLALPIVRMLACCLVNEYIRSNQIKITTMLMLSHVVEVFYKQGSTLYDAIKRKVSVGKKKVKLCDSDH